VAVYVNVQVLDVGQGSGTLVEVYDDDVLQNLVLIDLGSSAEKGTAGAASAQYVVEQLKAMPDKAVLDTLLLSHSDVDHINLIGEVLKEFSPPDTKEPPLPPLTIRHIWYGGSSESYRKEKSNVLEEAEKYLEKGKAEGFSNDATSWKPKEQKWVPFHTLGDVKLFLIIGNTVAETASENTNSNVPSAYALNMRSLVVRVWYSDSEAVITGDATGLTCARINKIFEHQEPLEDCLMLTVPHHGAAATAFDLKGSTNTTPTDNFDLFAKNMKARMISASAFERPDYRHPRMEVLQFFWKYLDNEISFYTDPLLPEDFHYYTAYFSAKQFERSVTSRTKMWPDTATWYTVQTKANIFTTDYFRAADQSPATIIPPTPATSGHKKKKGTPPAGVRWEFRWDTEDAWVYRHTVPVTLFAAQILPARPRLIRPEQFVVPLPAFVPLPALLPAPPLPPPQSVSPLRRLQSFC
jgi:beta-lactamase superfamily II metal-dependent hydrolase